MWLISINFPYHTQVKTYVYTALYMYLLLDLNFGRIFPLPYFLSLLLQPAMEGR